MQHIVLCIDDEQSILNSLKRLVRKETFKLITTTSAEEGLEILKKNDIQVVMSDYRMPEMTGTEFLHKVKMEYPHTIRIVLSGYAEAHAIMDAINKGEIYRFICKPWNDEELVMTIRQCIEQYELRKKNEELNNQVKAQNIELQQSQENLKEDIVQHEQALKLAKEILNNRPAPILCINDKGLIVMRNPAVVSLPEFKDVTLGTTIDKVFPKPWVESVNQCLQSEVDVCMQDFEYENVRMRLNIQPLHKIGQIRGCIIFLEEVKEAS